MGMNLDHHEYSFEEIVIGGSLNALLYAWFTGATLLSVSSQMPLFFERFDPDVDLGCLGFENESILHATPQGEKIVGIQKEIVWRKIFFLLAMAGQAPIPDSAQSLRIEDDFVKITTSHSRLARFKFKKLTIFDPAQAGNSVSFGLKSRFKVLDWMWVNTGMVHDLDYISDSDDLVSEIHFYKYKERAGKVQKNLVSVSYLNREQIEDYEYSDTYAKFKTEHMMKEAGIKGRRNGYVKGKPYHLNVKVTPEKRELISIDEVDLELDKNITVCSLTDEEILDKFRGQPKNKNIKKLLRYW